jgi:hypothetical protein
MRISRWVCKVLRGKNIEVIVTGAFPARNVLKNRPCPLLMVVVGRLAQIGKNCRVVL